MKIMEMSVAKIYRIFISYYYKLMWKMFYGTNIKIGRKLRIDTQFSLDIHSNGKVVIGEHFFCRSNIFLLVESGVLSIGNHIFLNHNVSITCMQNVKIGDNCKIANNVVIVDHDHDYINRELFHCSPVAIHNNVWIGANVTITRGVTIGENSIIAAGSVITKDIPANCIAAGIPAKVMKDLSSL